MDLGKYVAATFGGMTPGQQAAELAMVKPSEIKRARQDALELGIPDRGLPPLQLAMVVKAERLAKALQIPRAEAWAALHKVLFELMPYIHQKLPPKADPGAVADLPHVFLIPGEAPPGSLQQADDGEQAAI
ncbi:MAG TPA: hypothetical protein VIJ94_04225, partial [Caulobacteraceae bacterium]